MPNDDKNSIWVEGVEPAPKTAPKQSTPKATPFESEFGPPLKRMPLVPNMQKQLQKRQSKA